MYDCVCGSMGAYTCSFTSPEKKKGEDRLVAGESFCGEKQIKFSSIFGVPWTSRYGIFWQSAAAGMLQSNLMPTGTYGSECTLLQN